MPAYGHCKHCRTEPRRPGQGRSWVGKKQCSTEVLGHDHNTICAYCNRMKPPGPGANRPTQGELCGQTLGYASSAAFVKRSPTNQAACGKDVAPSCKAGNRRCAHHCRRGHHGCPPI